MSKPIPYGQPFLVLPAGAALVEKPAVKDNGDGTYDVTYRFTVRPPGGITPADGRTATGAGPTHGIKS